MPESVVNHLAELAPDATEAARLELPPGRLTLRRAWPRGPGRLLLEYRAANRELVAGQWLADVASLHRVARETARTSPRNSAIAAAPGNVPVLLQARGADRRLASLRRVLARPGARLVSHRPERRALVRLDSARYAKVVPPERLAGVVAKLTVAARVANRCFRVPQVGEVDEPAGVVVIEALPGCSFREHLEDEGVAPTAHAVGRALAALHASPPDDSLPEHGPAEEAAVVREWVGWAAAYAPGLTDRLAGAAPAVLAALEALASRRVCPVHRDFHDKQSLITDDQHVGLIDFDTLARGDAAVDLANLLVHIELRSLQEDWPRAFAGRAAKALLEGYSPDRELAERLPAYADATRIRLACVYAFRPRWAHVPHALLGRLGSDPAAPASVLPLRNSGRGGREAVRR